MSDDQCAWASINLQCLHPNRRCCDVPISRESCKKSTWKTAGKSSINSVANTFPNHQCRKEKEEKKRSTPVLLTLLAFFAIQRLRESLKDPKEKSQETKAHLLLALNTKSTLLLYKKNPLFFSIGFLNCKFICISWWTFLKKLQTPTFISKLQH